MLNATFWSIFKPCDLSNNFSDDLSRQENKVGIKSRKVEVMPLPPVNYERLRVQPIDLTESLKLQKEHSEKLKALQLKQAVLRLTNTSQAENHVPVKSFDTLNYREEKDDTDEDEETNLEVDSDDD